MDPFFTVERIPAVAIMDGLQVETGQDALVNADTKECVGMVSRGYNVVTNEDLQTVVDEALGKLPVLKVDDHLNSKSNKWVRDIILDAPEFNHQIKTNDTVHTKVQIINGYGSKTAAAIAVSMWRQVCTNGMFGWKNMFRASYSHITSNIVEKIADDFGRGALEIKGQVDLWKNWAEVPFTKDQFALFIDNHTKEAPLALPSAFLSEKQAEGIKGLYDPIMEQYNEDETKWGAYNVITAIASHHVQARAGSHIFSQPYSRMNKLANAFYEWNPDMSTTALTA